MNARYWARKLQALTHSLWARRPEGVRTHLDERLAILAALSQDLVWVKDSSLKFIEITASPSLQPGMQEVIGKRLRELPVRGVSDEAWRDHETTLLRQEPFTGFIVEAMISDQWRRILMCGAPLYDAAGAFMGYCGIGRDITSKEQHPANDELFNWLPSQQNLAQSMEKVVAAQLRKALADKEFQVFYQPIVDLNNVRNVAKAEALLRWNSQSGQPNMGPAMFIPIAERVGLIHEIGALVADEALAQCTAWRRSMMADLQISINCSPLQIRAGNENQLASAMRSNGLDGSAVAVEVTEGMLLPDDPEIHASLNAMRRLGINISIDDFGTGYSSLAYLRKFPFNTIKIDQSFIKDLDTNKRGQFLCAAIITLAHKLDINVIAEGVENQQQAQFLKQAGCDYAQGYYFAPPMAAAQFEEWHASHMRSDHARDRVVV